MRARRLNIFQPFFLGAKQKGQDKFLHTTAEIYKVKVRFVYKLLGLSQGSKRTACKLMFQEHIYHTLDQRCIRYVLFSSSQRVVNYSHVHCSALWKHLC